MTMKTSQPSITILAGGIGPEREVSLDSGRCLADALEFEYRVDLVDLKIPSLPPDLSPNETVVISVIHGTFGEDGQLQELLDRGGFTYAGSSANASRLCMNKSLSKKTVAASGVPVSDDFCFTDPRSIDLTEICQTLGQDLILKPTDQGSSVALYVISGKEELEEAINEIEFGNWMLEKRIFGREVTVGLLNGVPLGLVEVIPEGGVYDYKRKYVKGSTEYKFPAVLDLEIEEEIKRLASRAFHACECRDFSRIDFMICEDGNPYFLEVNTLPGLTTTSLLPKSASCAGYDFQALCKKIVEPAMTRFEHTNMSTVNV